jgi:outer membrane protein OmpA-like peptidoglycan-associated protein
MRSTVLLTPFLGSLMLLASCGSPPKLPTVDESRRRPVNTAAAVELQVCKNDLKNTRLLATEASRTAQQTAAMLASLSTRQQALANLQAAERPMPLGNSLYNVRFDHGSTRVDISSDIAGTLLDEARGAPLVMLRGRTDGTSETPAESRIARDRAAAVRDFLITAGVDPARIRATHQAVGDHAVDNSGVAGRALNRRVEIEIYRALPVAYTAALQR